MVQLIYSNSPETLLHYLAKQVAGEQKEPGQPITIVTPNNYSASQVTLAIARKLGIAANINTFIGLKQLFAHLFNCQEATEQSRLLSVNMLQQLILETLHDTTFLSQHNLHILYRYLVPDENSRLGNNKLAVETKYFDLSNTLALLFLEYEQFRPELIARWQKGQLLYNNDPLEKWQQAIWHEIFRKGGRRDLLQQNSHCHWPLLSELLVKTPAITSSSIHIFGLLTNSPLHLALLDKLAVTGVPIYGYALNPCKEYWEDVVGKKSASRESRNLTLEFTEEENNFGQPLPDPPALELWGRAGRNQFRLLNNLQYQEDFPEPTSKPTTILQYFQQDILRRQAPGNNNYGLPADSSLQIFSSTSPRREVETLADHIGRQLLNSLASPEPLCLNQIAIILPSGQQQEQYQLLLQDVFSQLNLPLIFLTPGNLLKEPLIATICHLLDLPGSSFERSKMLAIMQSPPVLHRFPDVSGQHFADWCQELAVFKDENWPQGLSRLLAGWYQPSTAQNYPAQLEDGDRAEMVAFYLLAQTLQKTATSLYRQNITLDEWIEQLKKYLETFILCQDESEQRLYDKVLKALERLQNLSIPGVFLDYELVHKLVLEELSSIRLQNHQPVTEGLVVGTLNDLRPNTFRQLYMLSMGSGIYPNNNRNLPFDLRHGHHQDNDISDRSWQLYHFLEALTITTERVELSYLSRDALTGDSQNPSSLLEELQTILQNDYLAAGQKCWHETITSRHDPDLFTPDGSLSCRGYQEALAVCQKNSGPQQPEWTGGLPPELPYHLQLSTRDLLSFLDCPLQQSGRALSKHVLYQSRQLADEPPLFADKKAFYELHQHLFTALYQGQDCTDLIIELTNKWQHQSKMPRGLFLEATQKQLLQMWQGQTALFNKAIQGFREIKAYSFGSAEATVPPFEININGKQHLVDITGDSVPFAIFNNECIPFYLLPSSNQQLKYAARCVIDGALLLLCGGGPVKNFHLLHQDFINKKNPNYLSGRFKLNINSNTAREWLTNLLTDYFNGPHDYLLPLKLVDQLILWNSTNKKGDYNTWWRQQLMKTDRYSHLSCDDGPIPEGRSYRVLSYIEAWDLIQRRFAPLIGFKRVYIDNKR